MDLRIFHPASAQIERAAELACRGLMCYQPFIFSEHLQTGVGFELVEGAEFSGLVYCPDPPSKYLGREDTRRFLIDPVHAARFADCNQQLRVLYESFIDEIEHRIGPIDRHTFADVGCCSGYFPVSFSRRGSPLAVGFDRVDYAPAFDLLNEITGAKARFVHRPYRSGKIFSLERPRRLSIAHRQLTDWIEGGRARLTSGGQYDVVLSVAMLVHLSDPLHFLAYLGGLARKAVLVWTLTSDREDELMIEYLGTNRYYSQDRFPYCFDVMRISAGLLRKSLEEMGFTRIYRIQNRPDGLPDRIFNMHRGYLAIKP